VRISLKFDFLEPSSIGVQALADRTTGYLRLTGFHFKGGDEVERAVKGLQDRGAKQLILDLRGNPGGFMGAAMEIGSLFLPKGTLMFRVDGRGGRTLDFIRTDRDGKFATLPLLVLIDDGSASASEALAASIQDHDRGLLLGRRSFGKALMQSRFPVPPQGDIVWLTTGRIVTPSGRIIQRSYQGLRAEQYYSFAGKGGAEADTAEIFHTDHGREVRGGGGVLPDIVIPKSAELPTWFALAADSGWYEAVSDSVAATMPKELAARARWLDARGDWQSHLVDPFLSRVRTRLGVGAPADSALMARLGRILAYRVAEVRWGAEAGDEFMVHNDPDIQAAMGYWPRLPAMLAGDGRRLP
jgi:carboxyl-terminal processing protease